MTISLLHACARCSCAIVDVTTARHRYYWLHTDVSLDALRSALLQESLLAVGREHDAPADHRQLRLDVIDLCSRNRHIVAVEHDEVGKFGDSYYYVDHYEVLIDRPVDEVWPVVVDPGSWMPGLLDANESRPVAIEGAIFRLYGDFFVEVSKVIPEKMLVMVNLPNSQEGEATQGLMMLSAQETDGKTIVSMFMSRIFFWFGPDGNALRDRRESAEFSASRRATYEIDILQRLKDLAEGN